MPIKKELTLSANHSGAYSTFEGSPMSEGQLQFDAKIVPLGGIDPEGFQMQGEDPNSPVYDWVTSLN